MTGILAIDDSPSMQQTVTYALERSGYGLIIVQNRPAASNIAAVKSSRPFRDYRSNPLIPKSDLAACGANSYIARE